jgi:DNA polymerase III psi subunit
MNKCWGNLVSIGKSIIFVGLVGILLTACGGGGGSGTTGGSTPSITATATTTAQTLTVGTAMTSFTPLIASGGTAPYTYSYTGPLPAGLTLDPSNGAVTGTPTTASSAANVTFSVADKGANKANQTSVVSFTVNATVGAVTAIADTTAQLLTAGTAMKSFTPLIASGGTTPYTYSVSTPLPSGLSLDRSTGAVTGTPLAPSGTASVIFSVTDASPTVASTTSTVSFTVNPAPVSITAIADTTAQTLIMGAAMPSFTPLIASGGRKPYLYSYSGTLPLGLSLDTITGAVTGTPTTVSSVANVTFSVIDADTIPAIMTSKVGFSVVIGALTPVEIAALTPAQIALYSDAQITALGINIQYLSDAALAALTFGTNTVHPIGQIQSISPAQIAVLSSAQIRLIGSAGYTNSQLTHLNSTTWATLVSDPAQVAAITPAEIATLTANSSEKIVALGINIKFLTDAALQALSPNTSGTVGGQIQAINITQIAALTPAQVRMIGAAGAGGSIATSKISFLNSGAWAVLVSDPLQVKAITPAEIATLTLNLSEKIVALGTNIQFLSDTALGALTQNTSGVNSGGQIQAITAAQIATLSTLQVRMIGATGAGGVTTTSKITYLNVGAWATLVSDPLQVAAITPAEIATLTLNVSEKIVALGTNIKYLSDAALGALTQNTSGVNSGGQIQAITAAQIATLSTLQVRMIGATGAGGVTTTSKITYLNVGAWATLVSDPLQVAAITPAEIATLTLNVSEKITALGVNIQYLTDAAFAVLTPYSGTNTGAQIQAISALQIPVIAPAQVTIIAGITSPYGAATAIAFLNAGAFATLNAAQIGVLTATNVKGISAAQLASLTETAIAGFKSSGTNASLTAAQVLSLSAVQHTACGC